jgi:hypothetical protein
MSDTHTIDYTALAAEVNAGEVTVAPPLDPDVEAARAELVKAEEAFAKQREAEARKAEGALATERNLAEAQKAVLVAERAVLAREAQAVVEAIAAERAAWEATPEAQGFVDYAIGYAERAEALKTDKYAHLVRDFEVVFGPGSCPPRNLWVATNSDYAWTTTLHDCLTVTVYIDPDGSGFSISPLWPVPAGTDVDLGRPMVLTPASYHQFGDRLRSTPAVADRIRSYMKAGA